jgi:hypothetical protein
MVVNGGSTGASAAQNHCSDRTQRSPGEPGGCIVRKTFTAAAVIAALILAPVAHVEPCDADCGNPYFDPNEPNNAQFLNNVYTSGITGAPIRAHR